MVSDHLVHGRVTEQPESSNVSPAAEVASAIADPAELVRKHYRMQKGQMLSSLELWPHGAIVFSDISTVPMWNHSAWFGGGDDEFAAFLEAAHQKFEERGRRPALYVSSTGLAGNIEKHFASAGYEPFDEESWLVFDAATPTPRLEETGAIHLVRDLESLHDFIHVFYAAFQIADAALAHLLQRQISHPDARLGVSHYVAYSESQPVCVGTLIENDGDCCIYNVGTSPGARNRGHAARLMHHLLSAAAPRNKTIFLQTTRGSGAERLYHRLGFKPALVRTGFRPANWTSPALSRPVFFSGQPASLTNQPELTPSSSPTQTGDLRFRRQTFRLPNRLPQALHQWAERSGLRLSTIFLGGWIQLLARYTRELTVTVGIRFPARHLTRAENDFLPLAITVSASQPVENFLKSLELQSAVARSTDTGTAQADPIARPLLRFEFIADFGRLARKARVPAPLALLFQEEDNASFKISYDSTVIAHAVAPAMGRQLLRWLQNAAAKPQSPLHTIEILSANERQQLLDFAAGPPMTDPYEPLIQTFERRVEEQPDAAALISCGPGLQSPEFWTYSQLNRRANQLAHWIRKLGVGPDVYTGICVDRPQDRIALLLAVFKAGGAAVPLDPDQPPERLSFYINDSRLPLLFTNQKRAAQLSNVRARLVCLELAWSSAACESAQNLPISGTPEHTAYIIYTSGSTGRPKGVVVTNFALAQHCADVRRHYQLSAADRVLQFASFHFDAAFEQILAPLTAGASLILRGEEVWKPAEFARAINDFGLTVIDLPTAYFQQLTKEWSEHPKTIQPHQLRLILVGGEAMPPETVRLWRSTPLAPVRLLNVYGPTETTITASTFELNSWPPDPEEFARVPIGRPRAGRLFYVLDLMGQLAPSGIPGELCIGGPLLARGYLNRPELTKEKFIPDVFQPGSIARIYRSGDLVRLLSDGNLEFLGRIDDQVKIRGFRIELGEIETVLHQHSWVRSAVVTIYEDPAGEKQLVAYVVPSDKRPSERDLRFYLKQKLPEYMVPTAFVMIDALPMTSTGKIDRRALPKPVQTQAAASVKGPSVPLELRLQILFEKVLRRRPIAVDVSFFELGGNSLQALELIVEIERSIGRNLPLETLYQSSTVEGLARTLKDSEASSTRSILAPLQPHGTRPPLFLIHTTPGDVLGYGNLLFHMPMDQPCYGIQSLGLIEADRAHAQIEDMAEFYIEQIRQVQPSGPYYLGGWCYGGIVAVEMAHQLLERDETVGLLALLETLAPAPRLSVTPYYAHRLRCFLRMSNREWISYLHAKFKYHWRHNNGAKTRFDQLGWSADGAQNSPARKKLDQLQRVFELNLKALRRYRSIPYPGRVTLFNATELDPAIVRDRFYGWTGLAEEIEIHTVPGSHDTMLSEPHVGVLARELEACLRRTQNRTRKKRAA